MIHRLFVYGTLAPGRPNEHVLRDVPGKWEPATVRGILHQQGWGAAVGFPGILLQDDGASIEGFIFSSETLDQHWERLDGFEGDGYRRVQTVAELENGTRVEAHIYVLTGMA